MVHTAHDHRIQPSGVHQAQHAIVRARRLDHPLAIGNRFRHRLFDQHVRAAFEALDRHRRVHRRRRQHVHHIHAGSQQLCHAAVRSRKIEALPDFLGTRAVEVGDADYLHRWDGLQGAKMVRADIASADNSNSKRSHRPDTRRSSATFA
jgi:hypothetical protein